MVGCELRVGYIQKRPEEVSSGRCRNYIVFAPDRARPAKALSGINSQTK
jgi:hypothetical protein